MMFALFAVAAPALAAQQQKPSPPPTTKISAPTSTLILQVKNVRNRTGVVRFAVFSSPNGWPDDKTKAVRYGSLPANGGPSGGTVTFSIADLPEGSYAISVLHDENQNHKLDHDLLGRPKEGIGFGNNPKIGFSTPNWKQCTVHVAGSPIQAEVDLRYP